MPFYKFGDVLFLQKRSTADWINFICERFRSTGKSISAELAKKICDTVENHSSYVQQLAWNVWIKTNTSATNDDVDAAVIDLLNQNSMLYYRYIEGLSGFQINFLRAIADGKSSEFTRSETLRNYHLGTSANVKRLKRCFREKGTYRYNRQDCQF